jgi:tetratricopeptide (TPR) repeat protein
VLEAAVATHDVELEYIARRGTIVLLLQLGRIDDVERALAPMEALCAVLHQPFLTWVGAAMRAMLPQVQGRLDEAERLATAALLLGQQAGTPNAALVFAAQMFITRLYQGRLDELEPAVMQFSRSYPTPDIFEIVLAWIHTEQKTPRNVVSPIFEGVMSRGISSLARDQLWLARIALLTDICTFLQDVERADELYSVLLPYEGCTMTIESVLCFGSVSRYLGSLATLLQRWDDAERHYQAALEHDRRLGPPLWVWTVRYFATMLIARDRPGDGARALELAEKALEAAQQLGLNGAIQDCVALKLRAQGAVGSMEPAERSEVTIRETAL